VRPPRALIPLLAVVGAAAVVVTAGAGAAIDKIPGTAGPALADAAAEALPPASVNAMTWNVCGDTGCPLGARPGELATEIARQLAGSEVGGRTVGMNAVFLQEVCSGHLDTLKGNDRLRSWSWAFAPSRTTGGAERACANGQGRLGVAVGTESPMSDVAEVKLPSPDRYGRSAVCGTVGTWGARLCGVQLSSSQWDDDPRGQWRAKQIGVLGELAVQDRVIIGGDFTERPESPALDPLYKTFAECDQGPNESRTGAMTQQDWRGTAVAKTDYLFISKTAGASCGVSGTPTRASDHRPLAAAVHFR
jgi:endonuclease/exonuclease/phosphatase family metal-dependent hydrolase